MLDIGLNELIDLLALVANQDAPAAGHLHPDARLPAISDTRHARPPSAAWRGPEHVALMRMVPDHHALGTTRIHLVLHDVLPGLEAFFID